MGWPEARRQRGDSHCCSHSWSSSGRFKIGLSFSRNCPHNRGLSLCLGRHEKPQGGVGLCGDGSTLSCCLGAHTAHLSNASACPQWSLGRAECSGTRTSSRHLHDHHLSLRGRGTGHHNSWPLILLVRYRRGRGLGRHISWPLTLLVSQPCFGK